MIAKERRKKNQRGDQFFFEQIRFFAFYLLLLKPKEQQFGQKTENKNHLHKC